MNDQDDQDDAVLSAFMERAEVQALLGEAEALWTACGAGEITRAQLAARMTRVHDELVTIRTRLLKGKPRQI